MRTSHKIILGDSRKMKELGDESVHLVITSPPYWQLKDYGPGNQIGFNDTYEEYINHLNLVWMESQRVLHPGCRLCVNIGDQFARSVYYGRYKVIPIRTEIIKFCESAGFDYLGAIIWQKVTTCNTTGGATIMGSFPYPRNGIIKLDYEFILIFKKYGHAPAVDKAVKAQSKLTTEEWNQYFSGHWNFPGEKQNRHLAMFPEELPRRLIRMFSFVSDTVLDPFLGSGTTGLAAKNLDRNSVGYEINEGFLPVIKEKLGLTQPSLFPSFDFEVLKQELPVEDFKPAIEKLPYIFHDPVRFERKADPKKRRFGSKTDSSSSEATGFYRVEQVLSPEVVVLNGGVTLKLLGVKTREEKRNEAVRFLEQKTAGQKVFIRFDSVTHDQDGALLGYLYLRNKTFLNAHLIKAGLAEVETGANFRYKKKFLSARTGWTGTGEPLTTRTP